MHPKYNYIWHHRNQSTFLAQSCEIPDNGMFQCDSSKFLKTEH